MKSYKTTLLLRDNLNDTGLIPSRGSYCASPDLIVHEQVADAQSFFKDTYSKDVNQKLETGSMTNFIYARAKNLDTTPHVGYIRMYASTSSLFMSPAKWKKNILKTAAGDSVVHTEMVQPQEIGVGVTPFLFNAQPDRYYCHVGYVTTSKDEEPDIPDSFATYDEFVVWIKTNPHIALRNFSYVSTTRSAYAQVNEISNPSATEQRLAAFLITLLGQFPVCTRVVVDCAPMGIVDIEYTVDKLSNETQFTLSGLIPAGFEGYIATTLYLPAGTKWPENGSVTVEAFVGISADSMAAPYAVNLLHKPMLAQINAGRLIPIGTCSSRFIK